MRKTVVFSLLVLVFTFAVSVSARAAGNSFSLANTTGTLTVGARGLVFQPAGGSSLPVVAGSDSKPFWSVVIMEAQGGPGKAKRIALGSLEQTPVIEKTDKGYNLRYPKIRRDKDLFDIAVTFVFEKKDDGFLVSAKIDNRAKGWLVHELYGPLFQGIVVDIEKYPIMMPSGFGVQINATPDGKIVEPVAAASRWYKTGGKSWEFNASYPGYGGTLQYFLFAGQKEGYYFGIPDPKFGVKNYTIRYEGVGKTWTAFVRHVPCVQPGAVWQNVLVDFRPYKGDWHAAADYYRAWIDSIDHLVKTPTWPNTVGGMMLCIMKQQKGRHVMWKYDDIGNAMSDTADRFGFELLALFGWAHGGHDHLYPEYEPDKLLGGEEALRRGIAKAQARGKKVYLYTNGQLMDTGNEHFWPKLGKTLTMVRQDGSLWTENWQKFTDQPGFTHSLACPHDPRWGKILLELAKRANDYGADGILFDQLGTGAPGLCFSPDHGHPVPMTTRGNDNALMLKKIADEMHRINPEFAILTEGLNEAELSGISYFHGCNLTFHGSVPKEGVMNWINGAKGVVSCDAMFRYTYPEVEVSLRNPNPLENRRGANYACLFAWGHEVEFRYPSDVTCVRTGVMPTVENYKADCVRGLDGHKRNLEIMKGDDPKASIDYVRSVFEFQRANAPFLLRGRFVDTLGFQYTGPVLAKAYRQGGMLGVVVWNPDDVLVGFSVKVPGARLVRASAPDDLVVQEPFKKLAPNSIRLLVWENDK